jgi:anaerobic magnesium-protoporphyrin IX monomethyl ester cyclase
MKIVLIILPHNFLGDQKRNCPLGILYIAAVLEQNGYCVEMVDLRGIEEHELREKIPPADVYGISATTPDYNMALIVARLIKENHKAFIVLGGPHVTALPGTVDEIFDKLVIGEGELAIINLLKDLKDGIEKRVYKFPLVEDLDSIPFPSRHMLPFDSVFNHKLVTPGVPATTLITSRGCPYDCSFCASKKMWGQTVRFRSPHNVIDELNHIISSYGVKEFRFHDDTIGVNKKRLFDLCEKMKPLKIRWRGATSVNASSYEILEAMKQAGCEEMGYGIESVSQNILNINNKKVKVEKMYEALANARKAGLRTRLFFIIGLPGEETGVADRTIAFIKKTRPSGVDLSTFVPFPGSDIYERPEQYGIGIPLVNYKDYVMTLGLLNDEKERGFFYKHPGISRDELIDERERILDFISEYNLALNQ